MVADNPPDSLDAAASKRAERVHSRFRWRVVPAAVFGTFGVYGGFLLIRFAVGLILVSLSIRERASKMPTLREGAPGLLWGALCVLALCAIAVAWWKGYWWPAALGTIAVTLLFLSATGVVPFP